MLWLLTQQRAKTRCAQIDRSRSVVCPRFGAVARGRGQSLAAEGFARRRNPWNETTARAHATAKNDSAFEDDEHAVGGSASLVDDEAGRPRRARRIGMQRINGCLRESGNCLCRWR